jgi:RNA polymerase sigma factor (TIGR02999 family)
MTVVPSILDAIERGDPSAAGQLLPLVYDELRKLAAQKLVRENPGQTLDATSLVHEAYLRLVGASEGQKWNGRGHFFAAAAEAMRRILVDNARRKKAVRHGGRRRRLDLDEARSVADDGGPDSALDLVDLDEAITKLAQESPAKAKLVELRYMAGLTMPEVAQVLGISLATAERHWTYAKAWLYAELNSPS